MIKKLKDICLILIIAGCISLTKNYQESVVLPEGTSLNTAQEIAMSVWNNNYKEKIINKFPDLTEERLNGLYIKWTQFHPLTSDKKTTVSIVIGIRTQGNLQNPMAIIKYGKSIVEEAVKNYFEKNSTIQPVNIFISDKTRNANNFESKI